MAERVRAAVIGCGRISELVHVPDYATCPEAELVALCDTDEQRARNLGGKWAPDARIYTDYHEMLAKEQPEAVTITLPNTLHHRVTLDALGAGCHVLVEKPMATSMQEAQDMIAASKRAGKLLMVNQSQRLFPVHLKAKEVLDSGMLGKVLMVTAMFGHDGPENWSPSYQWFFDRNQARFGAMADLGVHKADLIRYLTGKEVAEIAAFTARLEKDASVEDNFVSCLRFTDGTLGTLTASWTVKGMDANYTIVHCSNGTLRINEIPNKLLVADLVTPQCEIEFTPPPGIHKYEHSWGLDVSGRFIHAVQGTAAPFCTGEDAARSLAIILAAEQSAESGKAVTVA
ncbi:MAG: Gfo/Idh/MocA family oxidoreductase [Candidatus Hydrogenedentales bacterium]